jgi:hypothetical protein
MSIVNLMSSQKPLARHVFHPATSGPDRVAAWQEATGEPVFSWGRGSGQVDGYWFASVKRAFQQWIDGTREAELTVYHDGMGADALGPLDSCERKVLFMHHWFPRWEKNFEWMIRCTGRVMVDGEPMLDALNERYSWIPEKYRQVVPNPGIADTLVRSSEGIGKKRRTGIWLQGFAWKRYGNRLRSIIDKWPSDAGELEVIANGRTIPGWARKDHVKWSMDLPLEFALLRLHTWDSALMINDYSLDAPWLIRALELGCFPIVPDGESIARRGAWSNEAAPRTYEWGNVQSASDLLYSWRECGETPRSAFTRWAAAVTEGKSDAKEFESRWQQAKEEVLRHRSPKLRERKAISGQHPVALYERVQRLRAGY